MVPDDVGHDSKGLNNNPTLSKQQIPKPLENMFPVFVACQIIITDIEI